MASDRSRPRCHPGHKRLNAILQGFNQRIINYLQYLFLRYVVMSDTSPAERELTASFGYNADGSWLPRSTAAALICAGEWALEYPFPVPPKVHVRGSTAWLLLPRSKVMLHKCSRGIIAPVEVALLASKTTARPATLHCCPHHVLEDHNEPHPIPRSRSGIQIPIPIRLVTHCPASIVVTPKIPEKLISSIFPQTAIEQTSRNQNCASLNLSLYSIFICCLFAVGPAKPDPFDG